MAKIVLVVEDDPKISKLIKEMLERESYTAIAAIDGRQGVEFAKTIKPDLILMDIMMPYKDGYTACTEIKADPEIGDTPVIMLSALGSTMNKKLATRLGADGFLTKPFTRQELIIAVEPFLLFSKRDVNR
jgi:two-component system, OmpR family, response regulator VicR